MNTLKKDWKPDLGIQHILLVYDYTIIIWYKCTIIIIALQVLAYYLHILLLDRKMFTNSAKSWICFEWGSWQIALRKSRRIFRTSKNDDWDTRTGNVIFILRKIIRLSFLITPMWRRLDFLREAVKVVKRVWKVAPLWKAGDLFQKNMRVIRN